MIINRASVRDFPAETVVIEQAVRYGRFRRSSAMVWRWTCECSLSPNEEPVVIEAEFTDEEEAVLRAYDRYADELRRESSIVRDGAPGELMIAWREGEDLQFTVKLPANEQIFALLHLLRPLLLENERACFLRVSSIIGHRTHHDWIRQFLRGENDRYLGKHLQRMIRFISDDVVINSEATLQRWLNAYEYHRDTEKRHEIEALHRLFPLEASRTIFVMMLYEKVAAIRNLHSLVRLILGKQNTWQWTALHQSPPPVYNCLTLLF